MPYLVVRFDSTEDAVRFRREVGQQISIRNAASRFTTDVHEIEEAGLGCARLGNRVAVYWEDEMPPAITASLRLGATVETERDTDVDWIVLIKRGPGDAMVIDDVHALFGRVVGGSTLFRRRSTYCAYGGLPLSGLERLVNIVSDAELEYTVLFDPDPDRFAAIDYAVCPECDSPRIDFLPREHYDVPDDQLACHSCGGMFTRRTGRS